MDNKRFGVALFALLLFSAAAHADCFSDLMYDAELSIIRGKVGLTSYTDQTFTMLASDSRPNPEEATAIFKWGQKRHQCASQITRGNHPAQQVNDQAYQATQRLIVDLYGGNMTYGQFARQREDIATTANAQIQQILGQIQQQQSQQHQQRSQSCEISRQQCLNRARDIYMQNACQMESAGCGIANSMMR